MKAESIQARFKIFPFTLPSGVEIFRVTGVKRDGKQIRERLKTIEAATARQQELESEFRGLDVTTRLAHTRLTAAQVEMAETAFSRLGKHPMDFAVDWFLKNYKESAVKILLSDARDKFVAEKKKANRRERTIGDLEDRISQIVKAHPTKHVHEITRDDVMEIINKPPSAQTRKNLRTVFFGFFKWCVKLQYRADNPVDAIAVPKVEKADDVSILALDQCRALMNAAHGFKEGVTMPYAVLGTFCAIRPKELARLAYDWSEIDLEAKTVKLGAKVAKKRGKRTVEIPDCAVEMLRPHKLKKTPIVGENFRRDWDKVREIAGFGADRETWGSDVMRHTGISIRLAITNDENDTARWAGNSPDVIHNDYKGGFLTKETALEYYQIKPDAGKLLQMKAA